MATRHGAGKGASLKAPNRVGVATFRISPGARKRLLKPRVLKLDFQMRKKQVLVLFIFSLD